MQLRNKIFRKKDKELHQQMLLLQLLIAISMPYFGSESALAQNQQTPQVGQNQHNLSPGGNSSLNKNAGGSSNIPPQMVKRFDTNQDGTLDETEMAAAKAAKKARMLEKFDKNGDGNLSEEEKAQARQFMQEQRQKQESNQTANNNGQMRNRQQR